MAVMVHLPSSAGARHDWVHGHPFPHVVIGNAIDSDTAAALGAEYPPPEDARWRTFTGELEGGKQGGSVEMAGPLVKALHEYLASDQFVEWLRAVTTISDLTADPDLLGAGIHQSGPDARLGIHVDFVSNPSMTKLVRAANLILFVGEPLKTWPARWGGVLELGEDGDVRVSPLPGTLVIFEASDRSWHGHPGPLAHNAPLRKSVPAYYYRPVRDGERVEEHSTVFLVSE